MARLTDLQGRPLDWPTLHSRNEQWHESRDRYGDPLTEVGVWMSQDCRDSLHHHCRRNFGGGRGYIGRNQTCECSCHAAVVERG